GEPDHQRVGERPGLATEVTQVGQADPRLFEDLAMDRLLQRLARFDEAGERGVHAGGETPAAGEEHLFFPLHEDDDRPREAGEAEETAGGAAFRPLAARVFGRRAAATAELVAAVPLDDLGGPSGEGEQVVGDPTVERAQIAEGRSRWWFDVG